MHRPLLIALALSSIDMLAQRPADRTAVAAGDVRPQFEVASVRPNNSGTGVDRIRNANGTFDVVNVALKRLVAMAWGIPDSREYLISGPEWIGERNFDVAARYPPATVPADTLLMLQRLLEERFHMVLKHETREVSGYALIVGRKGPKLAVAADGPDPACGLPRGGFRVLDGHAAGCSVTMQGLADRLSRSSFGLDRPAIDMTGIEGAYNVTLDFADPAHPEDNSKPSLVTAIQEQLGLRVEARKIPLDVLVIDRADKVPAAN
jgi:uncharacterized protein (TIGR03435 family)